MWIRRWVKWVFRKKKVKGKHKKNAELVSFENWLRMVYGFKSISQAVKFVFMKDLAEKLKELRIIEEIEEKEPDYIS